jgi:hypothetical protein
VIARASKGFRIGPPFISCSNNLMTSFDLRGIHLAQPDGYARFNTGFVVHHDDVGDYSTNEPISALAARQVIGSPLPCSAERASP